MRARREPGRSLPAPAGGLRSAAGSGSAPFSHLGSGTRGLACVVPSYKFKFRLLLVSLGCRTERRRLGAQTARHFFLPVWESEIKAPAGWVPVRPRYLARRLPVFSRREQALWCLFSIRARIPSAQGPTLMTSCHPNYFRYSPIGGYGFLQHVNGGGWGETRFSPQQAFLGFPQQNVRLLPLLFIIYLFGRGGQRERENIQQTPG